MEERVKVIKKSGWTNKKRQDRIERKIKTQDRDFNKENARHFFFILAPPHNKNQTVAPFINSFIGGFFSIQ